MLKFVVIAMVVSMAAAATYQSNGLPKIPAELAHKKGCYVEEMNDVIPFGEEATPLGHCLRIECSRSGMYYATCGVIGTTDPKCYITDEDVSKPYPSCCPTVNCDLDNAIQDETDNTI